MASILSPPLASTTLGKILNLSMPHSPYLQKKPVLLYSSEKSLSGLNGAINTRFKAVGAKNIVVEGLWDTSGSWMNTTPLAPRCVSLNCAMVPRSGNQGPRRSLQAKAFPPEAEEYEVKDLDSLGCVVLTKFLNLSETQLPYL